MAFKGVVGAGFTQVAGFVPWKGILPFSGRNNSEEKKVENLIGETHKILIFNELER